MVPEGEADPDRAGFTVSIEARSGVTTGISTADRARTIRVASDPHSGPHDVSRPGHIFPIVAHPAGVLGCRGLAEAAVDIARFAGRGSAAAFCHVMNDDGSMAGRQELQAFAARYALPLLTADDVIRARLVSDPLVQLDSHPELPTAYGRFRIVSTATPLPGPAPLALVLGELDAESIVPVYLHRACAAGEAFGSLHCECGERLRTALAWIQRWGRGVVVHEPGSAPAAGAAAFGRCTASAPRRDPVADAMAPSLLRRLGVRRIRLLQGPGASDLARLSAWGLEAVEVLSLAGLEAPVRQAREASG
jgi:3,4-dihydroxy 2-butanone 4-phosphate synthase/GTP cyclohydrolase II